MVGQASLWSSQISVAIACILILAECTLEPTQLDIDTSTGFDDNDLGNDALSLLQMHAARTGRAVHSATALPSKSKHRENVSSTADADKSTSLLHKAGDVQSIGDSDFSNTTITVTGNAAQKVRHVAHSEHRAAHGASVVTSQHTNGTPTDSIALQPARSNHSDDKPVLATGSHHAVNITSAAVLITEQMPLPGASLLSRSIGANWSTVLGPFVGSLHARVMVSSGGASTMVVIATILGTLIFCGMFFFFQNDSGASSGRRRQFNRARKGDAPTESLLQPRSMDPVTNSGLINVPGPSAGPISQSPVVMPRSPVFSGQRPSAGASPMMSTTGLLPREKSAVPTLPSLAAIQQTFNGIPACVKMLPPPLVPALVMDNCESFFLVSTAELRQAMAGGGAAGGTTNILGLSGKTLLRASLQVAGGERTISLMMTNPRSPLLGAVVATAQGTVEVRTARQKPYATLSRQSPTEFVLSLSSQSARMNMIKIRFDAAGQRIEILGEDEPLAWGVLAVGGNEFLGNVENLELRVRPAIDSVLLLLSVLGAVIFGV